MKSLLVKSPVAMVALALMLAFTLVGCQSDADRIRATNEASALSAEIRTVDIEEGDCINSTLPEGITIESVVIVVCSGPWQYRALNSFEVEGHDSHPGEHVISQLAYERCDRRFNYMLSPLQKSWDLGYRTVDCLQASFGLSVSDPTKLDRLVSSRSLRIGECFNSAPETADLMVELVSCSNEWELRVLNSFDVANVDRYPGENFFQQRAYERCDRRYSYILFPLIESWPLGYRTIDCLQQSFGLSISDPMKLDRLVGIESLTPGECFNNAPETGDLLVELVSCAGDWELQVTHLFSVSQVGEYPGDDYLLSQAEQGCAGDWDFYYVPTVESWSLGDRVVTCTKSSTTTSATGP